MEAVTATEKEEKEKVERGTRAEEKAEATEEEGEADVSKGHEASENNHGAMGARVDPDQSRRSAQSK